MQLTKKGLSLIVVVFRFELKKQKFCNEGQMYVTLSRVTVIDNLFLIRKYNHNVYKVNENVIIEYSRLQENSFD